MRALGAASPAVVDIHEAWAWVVIVGNGLAGSWALAAHRWPKLRSPWLWRATGAAQVTVFIQVVLGVVILQGRDSEPYRMHMFYGFVAAFSVAIIFSYRAQLQAQRYLLYGGGGLFLMGLGLRAVVLHP